MSHAWISTFHTRMAEMTCSRQVVSTAEKEGKGREGGREGGGEGGREGRL